MTFVFKLRRDTAMRWAALNPVLYEGEPGFEKDTGKLKIGDGLTPWLDLHYVSGGSNIGELPPESALAEHIIDPTPHPAYDDGPSLSLLYANAKV